MYILVGNGETKKTEGAVGIKHCFFGLQSKYSKIYQRKHDNTPAYRSYFVLPYTIEHY